MRYSTTAIGLTRKVLPRSRGRGGPPRVVGVHAELSVGTAGVRASRVRRLGTMPPSYRNQVTLGLAGRTLHFIGR